MRWLHYPYATLNKNLYIIAYKLCDYKINFTLSPLHLVIIFSYKILWLCRSFLLIFPLQWLLFPLLLYQKCKTTMFVQFILTITDLYIKNLLHPPAPSCLRNFVNNKCCCIKNVSVCGIFATVTRNAVCVRVRACASMW